jgi:hypothetical protein
VAVAVAVAVPQLARPARAAVEDLDPEVEEDPAHAVGLALAAGK